MAMITPERDLEEALVTKLRDLKYEYRPDIRDRATLEQNFREKFEALNRVRLTDGEFQRLLDEIVTPDVFAAARTLRERNSFTRDDGTPLNYTLVNIKDWCKNAFEVVNQLRINTDNSHHRYDVILLINGVPVVQIELKTLGISPRRAMEQIVDYKNDPGNGYTKTLLCFIQLFIVSNRTDTWYFANNNARHFAFNADERFLPVYQFAAEDNKKITHLDSFAETFLAKCTLGQMISRYMVLIASEQKLLMMRPYQIYAVKAIVDCIHQNCGNGYIWHTTGSGKTLTSFKASTLLKDNPDIEKCLFVVDRKDLDRQTREEFNRFQEGCVEENTNTARPRAPPPLRRLRRQGHRHAPSRSSASRWTKTASATSRTRSNGKATYKEQLEPLRDKRMVFIFDECHRSQFGENHKAIKEFFPNAQLFGFTGTPDLRGERHLSADRGEQASLQDHARPLPEAAARLHHHPRHRGRNVLRFHVDYYKPEGKNAAQAGRDARQAGRRRGHPRQARRRHRRAQVQCPARHRLHQRRHRILRPVQDAPGRKAQAADPDFQPLNIACVFSPPAEGNKDVQQIQEDLPQEKADNAAGPREEKGGAQGHHRRLQHPLRHQPQHQRVRPLLPGRAKAHQRPAVPQSPTCPTRARKRSTSPSWWTCCSPASIPNTSTRSMSTRTSSTTA